MFQFTQYSLQIKMKSKAQHSNDEKPRKVVRKKPIMNAQVITHIERASDDGKQKKLKHKKPNESQIICQTNVSGRNDSKSKIKGKIETSLEDNSNDFDKKLKKVKVRKSKKPFGAKNTKLLEKRLVTERKKIKCKAMDISIHTYDNEFDEGNISAGSGVEDNDGEGHEEMLSVIKSLHSTSKSKSGQRSELSEEVSEFNLKLDKDKKLHLGDLLTHVKDGVKDTNIRNTLNRVRNKKQLLEAPLERPQSERIQRTLAYDQTKEELSKWNKIVDINRKAEQLVFPLNDDKVSLHTPQEFLGRFKARTPLEREVAILLHGEKAVSEGPRVISRQEELAKRAMDLHEARELRREMQKTRALLSYRIEKAKRQNKIKSKKFHRIQKREVEAGKVKEIEALKQTDPERAIEELEKVEKMRISERAALKHRQPGKWARQLLRHSKHDPQARQAIQDQIQQGKELLEKTRASGMSANSGHSEDSESEEEEEETVEEVVEDYQHSGGTSNPWMMVAKGVSKSRSRQQPKEECVKYKPLQSIRAEKVEVEVSDSESASQDENVDAERIEFRQVTGSQISEQLEKRSGMSPLRALSVEKESVEEGGAVAVQLNPTKYLRLEAPTTHPTTSEGSEQPQRVTIQEAFADDDVVADFAREKAEAVERQTVAPVDLTLPGWGSWAGDGIRPNRRKAKRYVIRPPAGKPRRDANMKHVIISEHKDASVAQHQVKQLPFQFTSVEQFQGSIRAPIGKTWNTETAFRELTKPKVVTKLGKIIEPITPESVHNKDVLQQQDNVAATNVIKFHNGSKSSKFRGKKKST